MSRLKARKMPPYMTVVFDPKRRRQLEDVFNRIALLELDEVEEIENTSSVLGVDAALEVERKSDVYLRS